MPSFKISGKNKKTGRQNNKVIHARNKDFAKKKAESFDLEVEEILELDPEPATEAQIRYAKDLGIGVPESPTLENLSYLLSKELEPPASKAQLFCLKEHGLTLEKHEYPSSKIVVSILNEHLSDNSVLEYARWYVYSVIRYVTGEKWELPTESVFPKEKIYKISEQLIQDKQIRNSVLKIDEEGENGEFCYNIVPFRVDKNNSSVLALSARTKLFEMTQAIVIREFGLPNHDTEKKNEVKNEVNAKSNTGCFSVIVLIAITVTLFCVA